MRDRANRRALHGCLVAASVIATRHAHAQSSSPPATGTQSQSSSPPDPSSVRAEQAAARNDRGGVEGRSAQTTSASSAPASGPPAPADPATVRPEQAAARNEHGGVEGRSAEDPVQLFAQAVELLQAARYADALEILDHVRERRRTAAVLYNIAICQRALGRNRAAIASLEGYLDLARNRIDEARRAEVETRIAELRRSIATITLRVERRDVEVTVDGGVVTAAALDVPIAMDPGAHTFRVTGRAFHTVDVARQIAPAESITIDLRPEPIDVVTRLLVTANVPVAEIVVDHVLVGAGSFASRIRPGQHSVEVRAAQHHPYTTVLDIAAGANVTLRARLTQDIPIYRRWWFWTGVGVIAAGAITASAIVLGSHDGDPNCGSTGVCVR